MWTGRLHHPRAGTGQTAVVDPKNTCADDMVPSAGR